MADSRIFTIDLNFQDRPHAIASYLIQEGDAVVLIETGPGSTLPSLEAGLTARGLSPRDITHVLVTHIHLDHAGASGWLAKQGAEIYVHPNGAPHLINPEKLIASATRIYGERMDQLWGEILPVDPNQIKVPNDAEEIVIGNLRFLPVNTPGHAEHHFSYVFEDVCFCGDVGGVRIPGYVYLRAPMPPPELHFGRWRESIARLKSLNFKRIAPTHFGIFDDADWQLDEMDKTLTEVERWLEGVMRREPSLEELREEFTIWMQEQAQAKNLSADVIEAYSLANPVSMSADGLLRYWKKFRSA